MNTISYKIGYWSALLLIVSFAAWIVCFTAIALTSPLFLWTNLQDYLNFTQSHSQVFQNIAKCFMLLFGPLFVLFINGFYEYATEQKKTYVRISLLFATAFAILSSLHYFVQLSAVRLNIAHGDTSALEQFVQANPNSFMTAADMTAWTLFLGLSAVFIVPVFNGDRLSKVIRYAFLATGLSCFLGGIGYVFQIDVMTFFFINIGTGGALMTASIASLRLFNRLRTSEK
jgi:hypothetical protein